MSLFRFVFHGVRLVYAEWAAQYVHPADDYFLTLSEWQRESRAQIERV